MPAPPYGLHQAAPVMRFPDARILLFAKAPVPGLVKTRLMPLLGAKGAAELYARMLEATVLRVTDAALAPVVCWCSPGPVHPLFQRLRRNYGTKLMTQQGEDLGARMSNAAAATLDSSGPVLLIGGDCPALEAAHVGQALEWLDSGIDAVVGPAEDGGYVLLGLRHASVELFSGIPWGRPGVLEATRQRLAGLGWQWRELDSLWDVDRPEDLARLEAFDIGRRSTTGR